MTRRILLCLLVLAAALGAAAEVLAAPPEGTARLFDLVVGILVATAAAAQLRSARAPFLGRGAPSRRSGRRSLARGPAGAVMFLVAGASAALGLGCAPLLLLIPSGIRALRRPSPGRSLKTVRDAAVVAFGCLVFLGSPAALAGAAAVTLLLAALLPTLHAERTARLATELAGAAGLAPPVRTARVASWAVPATALLAALLFVLLPRFGGAAAEEPTAASDRRERAARDGRFPPGEFVPATALRRVAIGDIGRLQRDFRPILEVTVLRNGRPADAEDLGPLFRGGALEEFDGTTWTSEDPSVLRRDAMDGVADGFVHLPRRSLPAGETVEQRLRFVVGGTDSLFCLGMPVGVGGDGAARGVRVLPRGEVRAADSYADGAEFTVRSVAVSGDYATVDREALSDERRARLLRVPPGHDATAAWARAGLRGAGSGARLLRRLDGMLRRQCSYSVDLQPTPGATAVEGFLFGSRKGHCELFAAAAAVALRSVGVPARVVIGFRGGSFDEAAKRYILRGADAHAWVEAWSEAEGWQTLDPTPSANEAPVPEAGDEAAADAGNGVARDLLRFDADAQRRFLLGVVRLSGAVLRTALVDSAGRPRAGVALVVALALGLLTAALLLRRGPVAAPAPPPAGIPAPPPPPEAWVRLLSTLAAAGIRRGPAETGGELAERALAAGAAPPESVRRIAAAYAAERWGGRLPGPDEKAALRALAEAVAFPAPDPAAPGPR